MAITVVGGLGLLAGGGRPKDMLHFVYAILALSAVPLSESLTRTASARMQAVASVAGALVAVVLIARLFQTG
jgi:hypothetical protein